MKKGLFAFIALIGAYIAGPSVLPHRAVAHIYYSGSAQEHLLKAADAIEACDKLKTSDARITCYRKI